MARRYFSDGRQITGRRLFAVRPDEIFEHPKDFPAREGKIPIGQIHGWYCYACVNGEIVGPFDPVVEEEYTSGKLRIRVPEHSTSFWYRDDSDMESPTIPAIACWYQSGTTLRFVRKRKEVTSS